MISTRMKINQEISLVKSLAIKTKNEWKLEGPMSWNFWYGAGHFTKSPALPVQHVKIKLWGITCNLVYKKFHILIQILKIKLDYREYIK